MRPPYVSVHMPSGTRISEPVSTGVAISNPELGFVEAQRLA